MMNMMTNTAKMVSLTDLLINKPTTMPGGEYETHYDKLQSLLSPRLAV